MLAVLVAVHDEDRLGFSWWVRQPQLLPSPSPRSRTQYVGCAAGRRVI